MSNKKQLIEEEIEVDIPASIISNKKQTKILELFGKKLKEDIKNTHNGIERQILELIEEEQEELENNVELNIIEKENDTEENYYDDCDICDYESTISSIIEQDIPINLNERKLVNYLDEKDNNDKLNKPDIQSIELDFITFEARYKIRLRTNPIYNNQIDVAKKISSTFENRQKVIQLVISRTQTGKTGCLIATIYEFIKTNKIPLENIFVITGLSSKDWKNQTINRVPDCLEKQVFHLSDLHTKFKEAVDGRQNVLVLIDEVQCACLKEQTISKVIDYLGWTLDIMFENDIKMVQFSATPDGILFGLKKWPEENREIHIMKEGNGYYGSKQMLENKKIKQANDLSGRDKYGDWRINNETGETVENEIETNILEMLKDLTSFDKSKYALIRASGSNIDYVEENIRRVIYKYGFSELVDTKHILKYTEDGDIEKDKLNSTLKRCPKFHSIILIKEKLKCAYTIEKENVGVVYERIPRGKVNDSFIIQGLLGRITGYSQHNIICYTNIPSIKKYEELFDKEFSPEAISRVSWNSRSSTSTKKSTKGKATYITDKYKHMETNLKPALPICCTFIDEESHIEFVSLFSKMKKISQVIKKNIREKLINFIEDGKIIVTTNEKGELYDEDEINLKYKVLELLTERIELKDVRKYSMDDAKPESRRFKSFIKVHNSDNPKPVGQSGSDTEFSIDMCIDDYNYDGCYNSKLDFWITYKK